VLLDGDITVEDLKQLGPEGIAYLTWQLDWMDTARPDQIIPKGDWSECGVLAGRGYGKGLRLNTPIPTPSGWATMGSLQDGDEVFDESGRVCHVVKAHEPYTPTDMYRVAFSDGSELYADGEHQWVTWTRRDRKQYLRHNPGATVFPPEWPAYSLPTTDGWGNVTGHCGPAVRTTQDIVDTLQYSARGDLNHCIPVCGDLAYPEADLPLDPWLLGYWLGNGAKRDAAVSCHHDDVAQVAALHEAQGFTPTMRTNGRDFYAKGLTVVLRALGVLDNKHVPVAYMQAAPEQRRALLAGLLDSDGHCDKSHGHIEFSTTDKPLADAVVELARSLGQKPVCAEGIARLEGRDYGLKWRVTWRSTYQPFRLPRKAVAWREPAAQALRNRHRMIVSVEPAPVETVRCITVDSRHATYLAGRAMIPTHNTRVGAEWLAREAYDDPSGHDSYVICPTLGDVKKVAFEGESGILSVVPPELVIEHNKGDMFIRLRNCAGGESKLQGFSAEQPERLRGPQATRAWCFIAGTMVATPVGERPIEALQAGDVVLTRKGPRRVLAAGMTSPRAAIWELRTAGGRVLRGTGDHPVWAADKGFVPLRSLQHGDTLLAWQANAQSGTGRRGTSTATTTATGQASSCIGRSIRRITALCHELWTSTTSMATRSITTSPTFKLSAAGITCGITGRAASWYPTQSSAASALNDSGRELNPSSVLVRAAETSTYQQEGEPSSASPRARLSIGGTRTPDTTSGLSSDKVLSVTATSYYSAVYDITVEDTHEFFANSLLVHNCDETAAWQYDRDTWDMMQMGLRLGASPQVLWTTTPKPKELIRELTRPREGRLIIKGRTYDNRANLPDSFFRQLEQYEGTKIGRQELDGELLDPEEAGIIKRSWFRLWPHDKPLPPLEWIIMSLDTAFTEATFDRKSGDPDFSACTVWGSFRVKAKGGGMESHVILLDCWAEQLGFPELIRKVKRELKVSYGDDQDTAILKPLFGSAKPMTSGRKIDLCVIEDKGSGISLRQMLDSEGVTAYAYNPGRADKLARLHIVSPIFARRRVWLPESEKKPGQPKTWIEPMVSQLCSFTGSGSIKHDDYVDACTQAMRLMMDKGLVTLVREPLKVADEDDGRSRPVGNPYAA